MKVVDLTSPEVDRPEALRRALFARVIDVREMRYSERTQSGHRCDPAWTITGFVDKNLFCWSVSAWDLEEMTAHELAERMLNAATEALDNQEVMR